MTAASAAAQTVTSYASGDATKTPAGNAPAPKTTRNNNMQAATQPIQITIYRWAGRWGPFKVNIPCGECALTADIVNDTIENELAGIAVEVTTLDWLSNWWKPLFKGGWHAPIVLVDGEIVSQGEALNRGLLAQKVVQKHVERAELSGTHVFGKDNCGHCTRAKEAMDRAGIAYTYHDVVKNPRAVYEMVPRTKKHIGERTPVTTPQIWIDGKFIGGADALDAHLAGA